MGVRWNEGKAERGPWVPGTSLMPGLWIVLGCGLSALLQHVHWLSRQTGRHQDRGWTTHSPTLPAPAPSAQFSWESLDLLPV